ncbi:MAG: hypothetical protein R3F44_14665 [Candidatus Competibacteraceae bacterium]
MVRLIASRTGRRVGFGLALSIAIVCALLALDRWLPPSVERARHVSALVLDSGDRILRAFTAPPGVWRLPARPEDADPLYIAMLTAYEDQRYTTHSGVDPLAWWRGRWGIAAWSGGVGGLDPDHASRPPAGAASARTCPASWAKWLRPATGTPLFQGRYPEFLPDPGTLRR